jgi:hypothetical protein
MIINPRRCLIAALLYRIDVEFSSYPIRPLEDQKANLPARTKRYQVGPSGTRHFDNLMAY